MTTTMQPSLWDQPHTKNEARERFRAAIESLALRLADERKEIGIIGGDVRSAAEAIGMQPPPGGDAQRAWSFLGPMLVSMARRGLLVCTGYQRRTAVAQSHGTRHMVYVHRRHVGEPR